MKLLEAYKQLRLVVGEVIALNDQFGSFTVKLIDDTEQECYIDELQFHELEMPPVGEIVCYVGKMLPMWKNGVIWIIAEINLDPV